MGAHGRHREAEAKMRELLVEAGLPEPGHVEYEGQSVYFDWVAQKTGGRHRPR